MINANRGRKWDWNSAPTLRMFFPLKLLPCSYFTPENMHMIEMNEQMIVFTIVS